MGLLQYDWDNETRIIHFCRHPVIKDMVPDKFDVVSGTCWTKPPPGVPRLVFIYLNHQMRPGGAWAGW
ncbi:hypothetical protein JMJ35_000013 [Cladonia borealis]|uniref:Uncharacterized protein n=1 Tax=Cladonia borealis TaxID=184061 RepID=A0AA39R8L7_9LECA|nr:hypothetical protein JMJ35_000013 [Cladonia borealis]